MCLLSSMKVYPIEKYPGNTLSVVKFPNEKVTLYLYFEKY